MTYIDTVADEVERQLDPERRPAVHARDLYRLYALLALTRGEDVTLEDVHDAWATWMSQWNPGHESIRPFRELDEQVQLEDTPYAEAIKAVARGLRHAVSVG